MPIKLTSYYHGKDIPELPGYNTFHSKELFLVYEEANGYTPILIVASEENRPVAKLLAVLRKQTYFLSPLLGKRCEVYGTGEYLDNTIDKESVFGEMLEHLTNEALRHSSLIEFRNLENAMDGYKYFRANNYFAINWLKVRNSLHSVEKAEDRFSGSRVKQIKKGLLNGAVVQEAISEDDIQEFSRMLHKFYSFRVRRYFPSLQFFKLLNKRLISEKRAKIYIVKYKGKIIGGSTCVFSGDNAYLWFSGGMTKRYSYQYPGVLAVWIALKDAKEQGYRHLEFVDVGLPFQKHGYRNFVLPFGGKQSSTRRWFRFRWNLINNLLRRIYA